METQNKQWVCHPALDNNSGQLGPEDLSSNSKNLQSRLGINDKQQTIPNKEQEVISDIKNKNGLDQFFVHQVEDAICENSRQTIVRILEEVTRLSSTEKLLLYLKLPTDLNNVSDPLRQPLNPLGSRSEISQTIMWIRTHLEEDPELSLPKQDVYLEYNIHCANNKMKPLSTADFGKVMKQVYPSVRPRRLGTRGNSRYCYAGLRKRFKLEVPQLPDLGDRPQSTEAVCPQTELIRAACKIICEWAETILGTPFENILVLTSYVIRVHPQSVNIHSREAAMVVAYSEDFQYNKDALSQELLPYSNHVNLKHKEAQIQLQRKLQQREFKRKLQLQSPKTEGRGKCKKSRIQSRCCTPTRTLSLDSVESESPKSQGYPLNIVCDKTSNENTTLPTLPDFSSFHQKKPGPEPEVTVKKDTADIGAATNKPNTPTPATSSAQVSRSNSVDSEQLYERTTVVDETINELKPNLDGKLPIPRLPSQKMKPNLHPPKTVILHTPKKSQRNQKYKAIQPKPVKCDTNPAEPTQGGSSEATSSLDTADVIQIAPDDSLKNADYLTRERLISVSNVDKDALDDYLHGGNNSQEQEEELMRYFKNNNNTNNNDSYEHNVQQQHQQQQQQQQSNNMPTQIEPDELSNGSKSYRLSQLRLLLEQNLNANMNALSAPAQRVSEPMNAARPNVNSVGNSHSAFIKAADKHNSLVPSASAGLTMLSQNLALQSHLNAGIKRRVSFETSVIENDAIPPSPNTRRKNFSFTPISPGPHSPGGGGGGRSKCSSTNASPFVSPRNTPVPRAKATNHAQNQVPASFVAQQTIPSTTRKHMGIIKPTLKTTLKHEPEMYSETEKMFGELIEEKHFVNPTDIMPKCNLPMSAPPSPMLPYKQKLNNTNLLQKLLDSNSKVAYVPDYEKSVHNAANQSLNVDPLSQEVSQLFAENGTQGFTANENSYRSQSVPLHQMTSLKTLMSPCMPNSQQTHFNFNFSSANNSVAPTPVPEEFSDFEPFSELNTGLNNENLNQILNILETTQSNQIDEPTSGQSDPNETPQAAENVFTFDTSAANMLNPDLLNQNAAAVNGPLQTSDLLTVQKLIRSQSIDIDMDMRGMCANAKYVQPSRSVPSTPLPYTKTKPHLELNLNNNQVADMQPLLNENMFACRPMSNQDFLLNGQPVKNKFGFDPIVDENADMSTDPQNFPTSLGFTMTEPLNNDNKINSFTRNNAENYGARRNLNTLLEQQYSEAD